jgi:hypothetical protein
MINGVIQPGVRVNPTNLPGQTLTSLAPSGGADFTSEGFTLVIPKAFPVCTGTTRLNSDSWVLAPGTLSE